MSKIKNSGSDQYDAEPFEQQQFGKGGVEGVNVMADESWRSWDAEPNQISSVLSGIAGIGR